MRLILLLLPFWIGFTLMLAFQPALRMMGGVP